MRDLIVYNCDYFAELYKGYIEQNNLLIYNERFVKLPFPRYVVFYNGTEEQPEEQELRLSDSFVQVPEKEGLKDTAGTEADKTNKPSVEVVVQLLNINYGCNQELMEKCQKLMEYSLQICCTCKSEKRYVDGEI